MQITEQQVAQLFPAFRTPDTLADAINQTLARFGIDTPERAAMFLAQAAHESEGFSRFEENLNYSQQGLLRVFGHHFSGPDDAAAYAHQPERIANRVYANRMGNGDEASGDGWLNRGSGAFQITGHDNIQTVLEALGLPGGPESLRHLPGAVLSAGWFWQQHGLNAAADRGDLDASSDLINLGHRTQAIGDAIGYADRLSWWSRAKSTLGVA